ncbi:universal stress protein A [Vibrio maritimus]|uniref:Universal stress protein A n=3 Tax=Vibrio TaxID=662 RepID=A0A090RMD7_9VIBR|nr:universal stress protein A [Vibrio maritimus]GAL26506.1 universal stress protein A [Vibrio variabilis]
MKHLIETMSMPISKHLLYAGSVENEIVAAIETNDIDLLIMGHHRTNAFTQMFSETESLVRMMPCDVMLVRLDK